MKTKSKQTVRKAIKRPKFNPARYNRLDKAPLETYIREFLIRNREFQKDGLRLINLFYSGDNDAWEQMRIDLYNKYKVDLCQISVSRKYTSTADAICFDEWRDLITVSPAIGVFRIYEDKEAYEEHEGKFERVRENLEENGHGNWVRYKTLGLRLNNANSVEEMLDALLGLGMVISENKEIPYHCGNTLLLSVNLNRTKEELEGDFGKILDLHRERRQKSVRSDVWKYYLIVFDLREQGLTYREIADKLHARFKHAGLSDERNIENYYHKAGKLIRSGYKKFI